MAYNLSLAKDHYIDFTASVPLPFTKQLINKLEELFYLKHYEESHAHYMKWKGRGNKWRVSEELTAVFSIQGIMGTPPGIMGTPP